MGEVWLNSLEITGMLSSCVKMRIGLDSLKTIEKEDESVLEMLVNENIDQEQFIIDLIYEKYPNLKKAGMLVEQVIDDLIGAVDLEQVKSWDRRQLEDFAELVAGTVIDFLSGYDLIAGAR